MDKLNLSRRLTHKYVGAWKHLDSWEFIATAKKTPWVVVEQPEDFDGTTICDAWVTLPAGADRKNRAIVARALEDTLSSHGCSHEWDCCGCASYRAEVVLRRGRRMLVRSYMTRNY